MYRAGMPCEIVVLHDEERKGWVKTINSSLSDFPSDYYVYAADDAYPSRNWLVEAYNTMLHTGAGLVAFNEGKFQDLSAGFGLVDKKWISQVYGDNLLFPGYHSHYSDVEIAIIAKAQNRYAYNPRACLIEVVFNKDGPNPKPNNKDDEELFFERMETGFGGLTKPMTRTITDIKN